MAWDASPSAGFSEASPEALWLPLHDGHERINVATEAADPDSLLAFYRRALAVRAASPALQAGAYRPIGGVPADVFAFERTEGDDRALVLLHLGNGAAEVEVPEAFQGATVRLGTRGEESETVGRHHVLSPWHGVIVGRERSV